MATKEEVKSIVSEEEWALRVDLAACYRLLALYKLDDLIFTHISAKVPDSDHFLLNAYGMMFEEITPESLVKVDIDGNIVMDTPYPINPAGFLIHSAVHSVRHDAQVVLHVHTKAGVAVSAQKEGLLGISQQSLFPLGSLAYHNYEGVALNPAEKKRLQNDLGDKKFLMLRNHGLLVAADSVANAFLMMYTFQSACEIQIMAQSGGKELIPLPKPILAGVEAMIDQVLHGLGGQLAWPGLLRKIQRQDRSIGVDGSINDNLVWQMSKL
eukprot:TRINITY_DN11288_c0_g1_i1.p1 TRINITY_DN11288_c0_g1~~TRINITY_DN11288_c0_g1_i1.p1  ORF type:complete len:285 (+),score=73.21 TRINITY_DN11288_c0_g1_i1:52-855(+)